MKKPTNPVIQIPGEVSVARLAEARGVVLRHQWNLRHGSCPFHASKKPTLTIDTNTNLWSCTTCRTKDATIIKWVMKAEGVTHRRALELLAQGYPPTPKVGE